MKEQSPYLGVILAAGHGSRMGPFGEEVPKPIVPICNKPLLVYHLEHLRSLGITEVVVVIGHLGHLITAALGDGSRYGVRIRYVEQTKRLGLAHAVGQLEPVVDRPFFLILGDIFFEVNDLGRMVRTFEERRCGAVIAVKEESDPAAIRRNFSVHLREDGAVYRVIEKPRFVESTTKGCGLYLFGLQVFDAIRRTPRTALRDEYELTDSIQILIDYDHEVRAEAVVDWDMNITFIGDLITCCRRQLARTGQDALVGADCEVAPGAVLLDTVLGDRVRVTKPVRLERCVVLSGVTLDDGRDLADMVITPTARLSAAE